MTARLQRLHRMDAEEIRFRASAELRKWHSRARVALRPPAWKRDALGRVLARATKADSVGLSAARKAAACRDWMGAHRALAEHFATRSSAFPLDGADLSRTAALVAVRFPAAAAEAHQRADRILRGRYDLLGYSSLDMGSLPDWHADPVRGTRAPLKFWASVPYLDPACGDHKLVWELNRHQHWLTLGRAFALTGDPACYEGFVSQLEHWLAANPPLRGINWASMLELALRTLSWLWALAFFAPAAAASTRSGRPWLVDLLVGLDLQLAHIEHNLSRYFSPNTHLSGEALALYVAGRVLPELAASPAHARAGRAVLVSEIDRQVAEDGGHVELSPHYHRYSTDFYLLALSVARASGDPVAATLHEAARRQASYLRTIADDDGRLPLIGDDDGGQLFPICRRMPADCSDSLAIAATLLNDQALRVGPPPEEAFWVCGPAAAQPDGRVLPARSRALPSSGYYVSRTPAGDHLVFDAGRHGYLNGGHAHSDALAVTLTVARRPLLIDPGTATYTADPEVRDRFRSTSMHNTVVVNGLPQSRPRGPFHWTAAAEARGSTWRAGDTCDYVEGTHDGYAPLAHTRSVLALHGVGWLIVDRVLGSGAADAVASWHLAPGWRAVRGHERTVELLHGDMRSAIASTAPTHIVEDECSPVYGVIERSATLRATATGRLPLGFATFVAATSEIADGLSIDPAVITDMPGDGWQAAAFEVRWKTGSASVLTSIEAGGPSGADEAAPACLWGTRLLRTDARTAALITTREGYPEAIVVNGTTLVDAAGCVLVELKRLSAFAHVPVPGDVAPSVHQVGRID